MEPASPAESSLDFLEEVIRATPDGDRIRLCLQCGTCSGVCPHGFAMEFPPHAIVSAMRAEEMPTVLESDSVWLCIACSACTEFCPKRIPVTTALLTTAKSQLILKGSVPTELQAALENSQRYGNSLGGPARKRADWVKGLDFPVPIMATHKQPVEVLWYVGDYGSYHPRVQTVSRALARVFHALDINFGILGPEEVSDGDSQRLAGERGLFEMLATKTAQALSKYHFTEIVTSDPHAYNGFKNAYPELGISLPVRHHTQFLADHLDQLRAMIKRDVKARVAYHDPCYLGRVNGVYDEPRALLAAIPGVELVEMAHNRTDSLCCGGGGGGMWLDGFQWERIHARTSEWRVQEAVISAADVLAVACPYEPPRFEDAAKAVDRASGLRVRDVAELLDEAMAV